MLPEHYAPLLVALSYIVAALASVSALRMGARVSSPEGRLRRGWLLGGSLAQGTGVWSMHFTGMLAFSLPVPIAYDVPLMLVSWVEACVGALLALLLTQRPALSSGQLAAGGLAIGAGIAGLHYTDMAAMRMPAIIHYSVPLVAASVGVACVFGLLSLWLGRLHKRDDPRRPLWRIWVAGAVMGVAIAGQHYTGMAAADFSRGPDTRVGNVWRELPAHALPEAVLIATFAVLALALIAAALDRSRGAQTRVSQRLLVAQERERRRIARALHDDLGQLLTALRLNLQRLASANDPTIRDDSLALVDEALARVRALSVELRPSVLDDLGLGAAIQWYANRSAGRARYDVTVDNAVGDQRFPEAIETAAYRVVQEALTNVARHAGAGRVRVGLARVGRTLEVCVSDDGCGFDVDAALAGAEAGESLGLLDMRETAMLAGGTIVVTSAADRGTTVSVRFPLSG